MKIPIKVEFPHHSGAISKQDPLCAKLYPRSIDLFPTKLRWSHLVWLDGIKFGNLHFHLLFRKLEVVFFCYVYKIRRNILKTNVAEYVRTNYNYISLAWDTYLLLTLLVWHPFWRYCSGCSCRRKLPQL